MLLHFKFLSAELFSNFFFFFLQNQFDFTVFAVKGREQLNLLKVLSLFDKILFDNTARVCEVLFPLGRGTMPVYGIVQKIWPFIPFTLKISNNVTLALQAGLEMESKSFSWLLIDG